VPFIEGTRCYVLLANGQIHVSAAGYYNLSEEAVEHSTPGSVELGSIDDLMEHDGLGRDGHVTNMCDLPILLEGDGNTVLEDALLLLDTTFQSVLTDMWEHILPGAKQVVDSLEFGKFGKPHVGVIPTRGSSRKLGGVLFTSAGRSLALERLARGIVHEVLLLGTSTGAERLRNDVVVTHSVQENLP
jgi:hypothetical protein